jgi:LPS export ABC transporter protein LptC
VFYKPLFKSVLQAMLFITVLAFFSCENDIHKVKVITSSSKAPLQSIKKAEIIYSDSAIVKGKLVAPVMDRYLTDNPYVEFPKGIKSWFYDKDGKTISTLVANYAINKEKEKVMEATGNVIVVNEKGEKLNTEKLIWDQNTQKIYSTEFVKITTIDKIIFGKGFESNQTFTLYKIFNITGTILVNKDSTHVKST